MKTNWLFFTLMCRRTVIALSNDRLEQERYIKALRHDFEDRYVPWNFNQGKNEMKLNDIALANVEALAQNEGGAHWWCCCYFGNCKADNGSYIHGVFRVVPCN